MLSALGFKDDGEERDVHHLVRVRQRNTLCAKKEANTNSAAKKAIFRNWQESTSVAQDAMSLALNLPLERKET